jgi:hypothetical protein
MTEMVWVKNDKDELVEVPKRRVSRAPQPRGNIDTYEIYFKNRKKPLKAIGKDVLKSLRQFGKYVLPKQQKEE